VGAAYLVLNLLLFVKVKSIWNRFSWGEKSAASFLLLLCMMAFTAWLPDGLSNGIIILRQPTPMIFAAVSAAAVAYGGYLLATMSVMPAAARIAAAAVAVYGVASFALAIKSGTPYPDLFHGASLFQRLPFWMQGAVIAPFLTIPSALVAGLIPRLFLVSTARLSKLGFKVVALSMSLVMVVAGVRPPLGSDATNAPVVQSERSSATRPPTLARADEKEYAAAVSRVDKMMAALEVVDKKVDRSAFEIDALSSRLGGDPIAAFHFVRDEIRYEPYYGVLRGARGTLICRAANSLDRSLLLAALVRKAGFSVQIVSGQLDYAQAMTLVARLFEPVRAASPTIPPFADLALDIARALRTTVGKLTSYSKELERRANATNQSLWSTVDSEASALSKTLNESGAEPAGAQSLDQLTAEAREHYWVRYQNLAGQWVDLDSAFATNEPGTTMTKASETFEPDSIPADRYHRIGIKLVLRTTADNGGTDAPGADVVLIDQDFPVANRQSVGITVANVPIPAPNLMIRDARLSAVLAPVNEYVSVLKVGDQLVLSKYFNLKGATYDNPPGTQLGIAERTQRTLGQGFGGATSALGGLSSQLSGGNPSGQAQNTRIVGQWLIYRLISPGQREQPPKVREYSRDIVPPETITGWSSNEPKGVSIATRLNEQELRERLMWSEELLPITGAPVSDFLGYLQLQTLRSNRESIDFFLNTAYGRADDTSFPESNRNAPLHTLALVTSSFEEIDSLLRTRFPGDVVYFDQPGLVAYESRINASTGNLRQGYDLIAFSPRVAINPEEKHGGQSEQSTALLKVLLGVLATRLEYELIADRYDFGNSANRPKPQTLNATEVFQAATEQKVNLLKLESAPHAFKQIEAFSLSPAIKAEIAQNLTDGYTIVIPERDVMVDKQMQIGWWRVDPQSGEVIGMMPGGRGQGMIERWLSGSVAFNVGIGGFFACIAGVYGGHERNLTTSKVITCAIAGLAAGVGTYGYWPQMYSATISGISGIVAVIAAFVALVPTD